ncbi:MAG TPA: DNA internalization-related competence protein ComEC/Rec2 [Candidatus Dormibacteraeota bacterium]|nr:DNA internalization-related competence protein ComEC/Rec2 [Candidatus Dormibacteraeota bacterium]
MLGLFIFAALALIAASILTRRNWLWPAAFTAMACWVSLGVVGMLLGEQPAASSYVVSVVQNHSINLRSPLRWHGRLRDEPARLPWGYGYELELSGVDHEEDFLPVSGGLRLSYSTQKDADENEIAAPNVHAVDEITVTTAARRPEVFRDEGAFDRRAFLASQGIDLVATLRAAELMERVSVARPSIGTFVAKMRRRLRDEVDTLFGPRPDVAGVLRAMLLGDRTFVDRAESIDFQRTGVFHVLVVAGLHVGAIAYLLFWLGRRLRLPTVPTASITLLLLFFYVMMVEQRAPVLRAALMAGIVLLGGVFYRRLDLLNSAGIAAVILLVARPASLLDSSFQLTFVAIACIAGVSAPWLEAHIQPYIAALRGWREVRRDTAHPPKVAQFRIDLRTAVAWLASRVPTKFLKPVEDLSVGSLWLLLRMVELTAVTLVLQIGMQPLMTVSFHRVALTAPVVNLLAVPMMGVMVPLGFGAVLSGTFFPALGRILAAPLGWMTTLLIAVVKYFSGLPRWSYRVPGPPAWLLIVFFCLLILLLLVLRRRSATSVWLGRGSAAGLLAVVLVIATFPFAAQWQRGKMELTVLDVGQGDSLFLVSPTGKTLLIDGGGAFGGFPGRPEHLSTDPGEEAVSTYLWSRGFKGIDVVALTHGHQDHLGGLSAVLQNFHVGTLWIGLEVSGAAQPKLEELAKSRGVTIAHELRGEQFHWDGTEGQVLWPEATSNSAIQPAKNNDSIVMRWEFGGRAFLLAGDAEKQAERQMLAENPAQSLHADVLKVGHHGSKNSTTEEFLAAVHPRLAVVSSGENNSYGHPSPELLERLETAGVRVLRTDRNGAVHILTDGSDLKVSCFVPCPESTSVPASVQAHAPEN